MGKIGMPIAESLKFSDSIINTVTPDLDDDIARRQARGTEGAYRHARHRGVRPTIKSQGFGSPPPGSSSIASRTTIALLWAWSFAA